MEIVLIVIGVILWYVIGVAGYVFHETYDSDITSREIPLMLAMGFARPLSFITGWIIIPRGRKNVIFKKRKQNVK